jgi:hypothetical protein
MNSDNFKPITMKFYLSTISPDLEEESLSVRVNNIKGRRRLFTGLPLVDTPEEQHIRELNELAAKPPFVHIYKAKKHDML